MAMQWFVLQALTGQELKVQKHILAQVKQKEMGEVIGDVVVPMEKVSEVKNGKKITVARKFFPGYVLVNMALYNDDPKRTVNQPAWQFVQDTPGVIGFIGGSSTRPRPLTDEEVGNIFNRVEDRAEAVKPKIVFEPGETVRIIDGPFMSFNGTVDEVDPDRGRLKVSVAIFGRSAPVELEYWQIERATDSAE